MLREVRAAVPGDVPALIEVFWRGVHEGAAGRYDADQRAAWLPERPTVDGFAARLVDQRVAVAEVGGAVAGFMSLRGDGYLDFAYVLPERRGDGTAQALWAYVLNGAQAAGMARLTTRASLLAQPFFARAGWQVVGDAAQLRGGVTIPAADMVYDMVGG